MRTTITRKISARCLPGLVLAAAILAGIPAYAQTIWTGPNITFTQSGATPSDTILDGAVVLTRGGRDGLYNTAAGEGGPGPDSPLDTQWAFGDITNFNTITFQSFESLRNGNLAGRILNQPMVVHLMNEDIYLSLKFSAWGQHGAGGFAYTRSTPNAASGPSVTITSPSSGVFVGAPATVQINTVVSGGTITNVSFFNNTNTLLGSVLTAPFNFAVSNLAVGTYNFTAVATAGGISATSAPVTVNVVTLVPPILGNPKRSGITFKFTYSTTPGLTYVVQRSTNLFDWVSTVTNMATGTTTTNSELVGASSPRYYRVGLVTGP